MKRTYNNLKTLLKVTRHNEVSLDDLLSGHIYHEKDGWIAFQLRQAVDVEEIVDVLGGRKKEQLKWALDTDINQGGTCIRRYSILSRLSYSKRGWSYCAGQCYTSELSTIRKIILGA